MSNPCSESSPTKREYRKCNGVYDPRIFARMPPDLVEAIAAAAAKRKISRSLIIREAVRRYVAEQDRAA